MDIKMILTDVDGVLTDGSINISESGELYKKFCVKDGFIVSVAQKQGIIIGVISGRKSRIVDVRCEELKISEVFQGVKDKVEICKKILAKHNLNWDNIAYIGDDVPDIKLLKRVKYSGAPADAVKKVRDVVSFVSQFNGGSGAFREFVETIIEANSQNFV